MKLSITKDNSGWVVDDIVRDFKKYSRHSIVGLSDKPDAVWVTSLWAFRNIYKKIAKNIFLQIHHIEKTKINEYDFHLFNKARGCIVPNKITEKDVKGYLKIPVYRLPYWLLSTRMEKISFDEVNNFKKKLCPNNEILIGSFQKDSVYNTNRPKLCKGADIFLNVIMELKKIINIKVVLAGYSRGFLIENFKKNKIPYVYFNRCKNINLLYDCLDWYAVTSRIEGGPQSVLECSYRNIKILSSPVGIAPEILHPDCICNGVDDFVSKIKNNIDKKAYNKSVVDDIYLSNILIPKWDDFFESHI